MIQPSPESVTHTLCFLQSGVCGCEKGYTEVMNTHGFLDYCTRTPGGTGDTRKADVKSSSGRVKPGPSQIHDFFGEWSLQALSPGNRNKNTNIFHSTPHYVNLIVVNSNLIVCTVSNVS